MGNCSTFSKIEKKHGQDGIDYVAFRFHQRRNYPRIKSVVRRVLDHANLEKQEALQFISQQKRTLEHEFTKAKNQAETQKIGSMRQAQIRSKNSVEDFSGFNTEIIKLDNLRQSVKSAYEEKIKKIEKRIRSTIMEQQNRSKLMKIKQFDHLSSQQRKKIQIECINKHPEKAYEDISFNFQTKITWQRQKSQFQGIFNKREFQRECEQIRSRIRRSILPNKQVVRC